MTLRLRTVTASALAGVLLLASSPSRAQTAPSEGIAAPTPAAAQAPAPADEASDLVVAARMERTLTYFGGIERRRRSFGAVFGLSVAALGGTGATLALMSSDPDTRFVGYLAAGAAVGGLLGGALALLVPGEYEQVLGVYADALHAGVSPRDAVLRTETRWQAMADRNRTLRHVSLYIGLAGLALDAVVIGLIAASPGSDPVASRSGVLELGVITLLEGAILLNATMESPIEQSLHAWRIGQGRPMEGMRWLPPTVALTRGGATAGVGVQF